MVYIIGIYHGILNDIHIYIRIYHGIYHNIFSSFISHCILVTSNPPGAALFSSPLHHLECSCELESISLYASAQLDPARLPPPIAPHPVVELIEPTSFAYPHVGICSTSSPVSKAVGQGGMLYRYVTHTGASAPSLNRSLWPCSSTASCRSAFNR
jgi:hypothetical protein